MAECTSSFIRRGPSPSFPYPRDYGVSEIHNDVDGTAKWNIHCVQPHWFGNWPAVFGVCQEMDLVNVHGMQFPRGIDNPPMLKSANLCARHGSRRRREFFSVDVKAVFVLRERHDESRRHFFFCREVQRVESRFEWAFRNSTYGIR